MPKRSTTYLASTTIANKDELEDGNLLLSHFFNRLSMLFKSACVLWGTKQQEAGS